MAWKQGPMPPDTWNWGGVVPRRLVKDGRISGFFFADFCGDKVKVFDQNCYDKHTMLSGDEVAWYNNDLDMPPGGASRCEAPEGDA